MSKQSTLFCYHQMQKNHNSKVLNPLFVRQNLGTLPAMNGKEIFETHVHAFAHLQMDTSDHWER